MRFSKAELGVLDQVARGNKAVKSVAEALDKGQRRIYDAIKALEDKGFVELKKGVVQLKEGLHVALLLQALAEIPNLPETLANSGVPIMLAALESATIQDIQMKTGLKKTAVYDKINQCTNRSILLQEDGKLIFNEKLWARLADALRELQKFESKTDRRIPVSATIYVKDDDELIFSCKEHVDATPTAFSAYKEYGIRLLLAENYYCLPKKKLTKQEVFRHSLYIADQDKDVRTLTLIALFYAKYRKELTKIKHVIIPNIDKVLKKQRINGYPTYQEIKDRAEVYEIEV